MKNPGWLILLFALVGFAIAEPVYELFRQTPEFLIARQNNEWDVWALTALLSFGLPLMITAPGKAGDRVPMAVPQFSQNIRLTGFSRSSRANAFGSPLVNENSASGMAIITLGFPPVMYWHSRQ